MACTQSPSNASESSLLPARDCHALPRRHRRDGAPAVSASAGDRYFFDGKAGYAWSPAHYDEQGNTTLEFEGMVIWSYFGLGVQLMRASFDDNLDRAAYLTDACVYGLFSLHSVSMLLSALADYDREYGHVMPYGDVPLLFMLSAVLFVTKLGYDAAKQA